MKITITIDPGSNLELMQLYEESNRILAAYGKPQWVLEDFCTVCLAMGWTSHMINNARAIINGTKKKYNIEETAERRKNDPE